MSKKKAAAVKAFMYDVIKSPVVTEKSQGGIEKNKITFRVAPDATKPQIKAAVEALFSVEVVKVNVLNRKGKLRRFRGILGQKSDIRNAIVTLKAGQTVDLTAGI